MTTRTLPAAASRPRTRTIAALRKQIDQLDDRLLELLNQRAALAVEVGKRKARDRKRVFAPDREKGVLARLEQRNGGPLRAELLRPIFREVISACRSLEEPVAVAYLGPEGTFSHQAAREQFGAASALTAASSIGAVFDEVEHGRADYGVVPVENSSEGVVTATLDRFADSPLTIKAESLLRVNLLLLSRSGRPERVRRIVSMVQPLGQCRGWLAAHFPDVPVDEVSSTAKAAALAAADERTAAVAGVMAQERYRLHAVAINIQDQPRNFTRFLILGRDPIGPRSGDDKTSILFTVRHEAGALHRVLRPFADHRVNLLSIESRPMKGRPWEYVFFLDVSGHVQDARVGRALEALRPRCVNVRVLGSYPVSRALEPRWT
jgi:chorismate mutase/prephenate dehydratase